MFVTGVQTCALPILLCALLALVVQLLRFLRADADLTLLWAEWQVAGRGGVHALLGCLPFSAKETNTNSRRENRSPAAWVAARVGSLRFPALILPNISAGL